MEAYQKISEYGTPLVSITIIGTRYIDESIFEIYAWALEQYFLVEDGRVVIESGGSYPVVIQARHDDEGIEIIKVIRQQTEGYSVIFPEDLVRFENGKDYDQYNDKELFARNLAKAEEYFQLD